MKAYKDLLDHIERAPGPKKVQLEYETCNAFAAFVLRIIEGSRSFSLRVVEGQRAQDPPA